MPIEITINRLEFRVETRVIAGAWAEPPRRRHGETVARNREVEPFNFIDGPTTVRPPATGRCRHFARGAAGLRTSCRLHIHNHRVR